MQKIFFLDEPGEVSEVLELKNSNSKSEVLGIIFGKGTDVIKVNLITSHLQACTSCITDFRVVLYDQAKCVIKGLIKIAPNANQTNAFLSIKSVLLSDKCQIVTEPSLEIEANDVKASHSASSGPIDSEQIFYLQSRGLDEKLSQQMLVEGFVQEVIDKIEDDKIRQDISRKIYEKFC